MSVPPTHLVVFGRPGSGKSSLAERLGEEYQYLLISTGELLREAVRRNDTLGQRVQGFLARGQLVPDDLIFELLEVHLQVPPERKVVFDGFPRTMGQVPLLAKLETLHGFQVDAYLEIAVSRAEAVARMTGRRVCPACGSTYHVRNNPPQVEGVCDHDRAALQTRPDDRPEIVKVRQDDFDAHGLAILDYYQQHAPDRYLHVDGEQPPDKVHAEAICKLQLAQAAGT